MTEAAAEPVRRLTLSQILEAKDVIEEDLFIPEWNGSVRIRSFTKQDQAKYREMARNPDTGEMDNGDIEMAMFIVGVIDPRFEESHYAELRKKSAGAVDRIVARLVEISGFNRKAEKAAERAFPEG